VAALPNLRVRAQHVVAQVLAQLWPEGVWQEPVVLGAVSQQQEWLALEARWSMQPPEKNLLHTLQVRKGKRQRSNSLGFSFGLHGS
jgi:hypothetical protein